MRNSLADLHDLLYEQLERLSNEDLTRKQLDIEVVRAKSMCDVSIQIISNAGMLLKASIAADNFLQEKSSLPRIMGGDENRT